MSISPKNAPLHIMMIATILIVFLAPDPSSAGDGFLWNRSDDRLFSEGESGYPDIGAGSSGRSHVLFPQGRTTRFISVQVGQRSMEGGDFEGDHFYHSDTELFMVPKMDPATFLGLYVDFRDGAVGGGIGYSQAAHDYSWLGLSAEQLPS